MRPWYYICIRYLDSHIHTQDTPQYENDGIAPEAVELPDVVTSQPIVQHVPVHPVMQPSLLMHVGTVFILAMSLSTAIFCGLCSIGTLCCTIPAVILSAKVG